MKRNYGIIRKVAVAVCALMAMGGWLEVWGQEYGNQYNNTYQNNSIRHKTNTKWHDMRSGGNFVDTFNDDIMTVKSGDGRTDIQAAHTYVDTLYVRKGSSVELKLPTISNGETGVSTRKYQRWYNFLNEKTFATGNTGRNQVQDLLTPAIDGTFYRFTNGYVGGQNLIGNNIMYKANFYYPTDGLYNNYSNKHSHNNNDYYVVACDVSGYNDFEEDFQPHNNKSDSFRESNYLEPTISLRVLYYIVGIDEDTWESSYLNEYERLNTATYQGGTNNGNESYLEEYEIVFPCDHISDFTHELVAINRQAQYYRIPGDNADEKLIAKFDDGNNLFEFVNNGSRDSNRPTNNGSSLTLGDNSRIIFFQKQDARNREPWNVPDGTTATILVTKESNNTTYNIARFKLTFKKNTRLLTQHQISRLDNARNNNTSIREDWYNREYLYRTPEYLDKEYILLTSRTFDYDKSVNNDYNYIQSSYYPFPLDWNFSSYAFYDGSNGDNFEGTTAYAEWGSYTIVDNYLGYSDTRPSDPLLGGRTDGYFIYVDASSLQGKLVTLPFTENLCAGSELLVSAWVKSSGEAGSNSDDAAILFTINGIDEKGNRTPIYRQSTGQIRRTTHFDTSDGEEYTNTNGYGSNQNDWYHVFFSFVNDDPAVANFKEYEVVVNNNCGSTTGGDFYFDDLKVYIAKPLAQVQQLETACSTERTLMNLQLDWERLMARVGDENENVTKNLALCFVDTLIFHNTYFTNGRNATEAIKASVVDLGKEGQSYSYRVLTYNTTFNQQGNAEYDKNNVGGNLAANNNDKFFYYTSEDEEFRALAVDFYGSLSPGRAYWVLMVPEVADSDIKEMKITMDGVEKTIHVVDPDIFALFYTEPCAMTADFKVTGNTTIKVDGEIVRPDTKFCRGNVNNFTVELKIPNLTTSSTNDSITISEGIYFDWFFGEARDGQIADPQTQYTEKVRVENNQLVADNAGVSMEDALKAFRNEYPHATELSTTSTPITEDFTQEMYDLIDYYLYTAEAPTGALNRTLVLYQPALNITLLQTMRVVIQPIPLSISTEDLEDWGYDNSSWMNLCWGYTYLELTTTDEAPSVYPGFNSVKYPAPEDLHNQSIRIGLDQIKEVSTSGSKTLTVDLREAKSYRENNTNFALQLIGGKNNPDNTYNKLFLTDTDDPNMKRFIDMQGTDFDNRSLPIGTITKFEAHHYGEGSTDDTNEMEIQFNLNAQNVWINGERESFTFKPREGFYYTFNVYYEEQTRLGEKTACYGRFPVTMKVVPEYLIWNGTNDGKSNWNNDDNWKRVNTPSRLKQNGSGYLDNNDTEKAFVPMLFSKVIMPENSKVELYAAGFTNSGDKDGWTGVENRPEGMGDPTENIQYDLMVFEHTASTNPSYTGLFKTERYRVSLCDQIHFEPGAEMLHAEYLLYKTAWVDYKLQKGRWYTLASPLQDVVAGDFYTDTNGEENSEYFTQIPDFNLTDNNRFQPSVYQRGWKGSNATLQTLNDGTKDVAIAGNWSSVYNDVDEKYVPGTGFSLKVQDVTGEATFRLPKYDETYSYFSHGGSNGGNTSAAIDRSKYGKLKSDVTFTRNTNMDNASEGTNIKVPLTEVPSNTNNGTTYYLVGNPFMAHLDATKFFDDTNNPSLAKKYWLVNGDETSQTVAIGTMEDYVANNGDNTIAPLQSFFVTVAEGQTAPDSITFTRDMQVLGGTNDNLRSSDILYLTATTQDGKQSRAALVYNLMSSKDYEASEDAELFLDSNLSDVPMVYTVAGTMATSINQTSELYNIPVGVYSQGAKGENVSLTFSGLSGFSYATLYDAETGTDTPLHEGSSFNVPANTNGRYFIRAGVPTANEAVQENAIRIYSVGGQLVIASTDLLQQVYIYDFAGRLVDSETGLHTTRYTTDLPAGNYMVKARSVSGEKIEKFKLRN